MCVCENVGMYAVNMRIYEYLCVRVCMFVQAKGNLMFDTTSKGLLQTFK